MHDATSEGQPLAPFTLEEGEKQLGGLGFPVESHLVLAWVMGSSLPPSFSTTQSREVWSCLLHSAAPRKKRPLFFLKVLLDINTYTI